MTPNSFRALALSFEDAIEKPHFEITSFCVGKKIFATLNAAENCATLRLPELQQDAIISLNGEAFYPVPNKWGARGWTHVNLKKVKKGILADALAVAYEGVVQKKITRKPTPKKRS